MDKVHLFRLPALLALCLAIGAGCGKQEAKQGGPPPGFEMVFPVTVAAVEHGPITETAMVVGSVRWARSVELRAETDGRLLELSFREGERFKQGDPIARLDTADFQVVRASHEADLAKAQRELEELESGSRQEVLDRLQAEIEEAEARLMLAGDELRRSEALYKADVQAEAEVVRARSEMARTKALLAQTKARHAEASNGARPEAIRVAQAEVAVHQAKIAEVQRKIEKCLITAPYDGVVLRKATEEGAYLRSGDNLVQIASTGEVEAIMGIAEDYVRLVPAGVEFSLTADAYPDEVFQAKVVAVIPVADERSRNIRVRCQILDPRDMLVAGLFVRARVPVASNDNAVLVPEDAITLRDDQQLVFTVNDDNTVQMLPARVGLRNGSQTELLEPVLEPGVQVVTTGGEVLFPGAKVMLPGQGGPPGAPGPQKQD